VGGWRHVDIVLEDGKVWKLRVEDHSKFKYFLQFAILCFYVNVENGICLLYNPNHMLVFRELESYIDDKSKINVILTDLIILSCNILVKNAFWLSQFPFVFATILESKIEQIHAYSDRNRKFIPPNLNMLIDSRIKRNRSGINIPDPPNLTQPVSPQQYIDILTDTKTLLQCFLWYFVSLPRQSIESIRNLELATGLIRRLLIALKNITGLLKIEAADKCINDLEVAVKMAIVGLVNLIALQSEIVEYRYTALIDELLGSPILLDSCLLTIKHWVTLMDNDRHEFNQSLPYQAIVFMNSSFERTPEKFKNACRSDLKYDVSQRLSFKHQNPLERTIVRILCAISEGL
jgi:hypothetical protein